MESFTNIRNDFICRLPARLQIIKNNQQQQNFEAAIREAHNIKGSAAMMGLMAVSEAASAVETAFLQKICPQEAIRLLHMEVHTLTV